MPWPFDIETVYRSYSNSVVHHYQLLSSLSSEEFIWLNNGYLLLLIAIVLCHQTLYPCLSRAGWRYCNCKLLVIRYYHCSNSCLELTVPIVTCLVTDLLGEVVHII